MSSQGISFGRIAVKRFVRFFLLASTLALFITTKQVSAMQSAPPGSANPVQPQAANQASSHDRHNRKHSNGKRHHHHRKATTKH